MKFEVHTTQWGAEDEAFAGGEHEVSKPSAAFLKLLGSAEDAGVVTILEATDEERSRASKHLQSQEDGEKAYADAQESGDWHEGNLQQFELDVAAGQRTEDIPEPGEVEVNG